jgi:ribonuclease-3
VLGLVVADMLYRKLPKANEGALSRALNTLVRKETCAEVARELDIVSELNLGDAVARTGGATKEAILGDVAEAVIGAVYCDGGLGKAYELVERLFGEHLGQAGHERTDAKTTLQEWAQSKGLEPPAYVEVERVGPDHAPEFTIEVKLPGHQPLRATGPNKKLAEHKAAEAFLVREKVWKAGL